MDIHQIVLDNVGIFMLVFIVSFVLSALRGSFGLNGNTNPADYLRFIMSGVVLSLLYSMALFMDSYAEAPIMDFNPVIHLAIVALLSLWGLDIVYWLVSFGKDIRANGPINAIKEVIPGLSNKKA